MESFKFNVSWGGPCHTFLCYFSSYMGPLVHLSHGEPASVREGKTEKFGDTDWHIDCSSVILFSSY